MVVEVRNEVKEVRTGRGRREVTIDDGVLGTKKGGHA